MSANPPLEDSSSETNNVVEIAKSVENVIEDSIEKGLEESFDNFLHRKGPNSILNRFVGHVIIDNITRTIVVPKNNPKDFIGIRGKSMYNKFIETALDSCKLSQEKYPILKTLSDNDIKRRIKLRFGLRTVTSSSNLFNADVDTAELKQEYDKKKNELNNEIERYNSSLQSLNSIKQNLNSVILGLRNYLIEYNELSDTEVSVFKDKVNEIYSNLLKNYSSSSITNLKD